MEENVRRGKLKKVKNTNNTLIDFKELRNEKNYRNFMQWALKYADMICVTCEGMFYEDFIESKWGFLKESILDYEYTSDTPVTSSLGDTFLVLYLKIDYITNQWVKSKSNIYDFRKDVVKKNGRYSWLWDICLCKEGSVIFYSCTHEEYCTIDEKVLEEYNTFSVR